jgi:predicted CoA-binding protein
MAIHQRADGAAGENTLIRLVMLLRAPRKDEFIAAHVTLDAKTLGVARPAAEADSFWRVAVLQRSVPHDSSVARNILAGMADAVKLLSGAKTVLLIDWPSRDVPDTLARGGFTVVSSDGPDEYNAYEVEGAGVRVRPVGEPPKRADLVYTHRPIDELPDIIDAAKAAGAKAVWIQSGLDQTGEKDPRGCWFPDAESAKARGIVEREGLIYIESPYIADAVRGKAVKS